MCQKRGRASPIRHHHVPTTPTSDFPNRRKVIKLSLSNALTEFRKKVRYIQTQSAKAKLRCLHTLYTVWTGSDAWLAGSVLDLPPRRSGFESGSRH